MADRGSLSTSWTSASPSAVSSPSAPPDDSSGDDDDDDDETATAATAAAAGASSAAAAPPGFDAAADAMAAAAEQLYKFLYAYAALAFNFLYAHGAVAYEFVHAHAVVAFEFVYAYATVAVHEAMVVLKKARSWARSAWQRVEERSPASVKRVMRHSFFPVMVSVVLSLLLVLPAYWAIPRGGGQQRFSAQEWQVSCGLSFLLLWDERLASQLSHVSLLCRIFFFWGVQRSCNREENLSVAAVLGSFPAFAAL